SVKETGNGKSWGENELGSMGKMGLGEKFMIGIFVIGVRLWIVGSLIDIDGSLRGFIGVGLLLLRGVLRWEEILKETGGW
uniref:anion permease n=1 Tax=Staphylococcus aureus TaxID=1280 RepID=UPI001642CCC9